jgi:Amt family ammonium transporter
MALEWYLRGKPSVLGMISGAVAGLGTITPASGFVLPWHGMLIGIVAGSICFWACTVLKRRFKYDDSLDVFGVHGIGGATGTLLCGVFAAASVSVSADAPAGLPGLLEGNPAQLLTQLYGVIVTAAWCAAATFGLLRLVGFLVPLRASTEDEIAGLDISLHGEALQ